MVVLPLFGNTAIFYCHRGQTQWEIVEATHISALSYVVCVVQASIALIDKELDYLRLYKNSSHFSHFL